MTSPIPIITNNCHQSDKRRGSCCSYCQEESYNVMENPFDQQPFGLTPPLENVYYCKESDETRPFSHIYLLNLFLAPDMKRYLQETTFSDDVYTLPIHLQRLICEARMDVDITQHNNKKQGKAFDRLLKLKSYVESVSHHDVENIITILNELVRDDDELNTILGG